MTIARLLRDCRRRGLSLFLEDGQLRFRGPPGALTPELRARIGAERDAVIALLHDEATTGGKDYPLAAGQEAIWLLEASTPGTPVNHLGIAVRFPIAPAGGIELLRRAAQILVDTHPMLRATFHVDDDGDLYQRIAPSGEAAVTVRTVPAGDEAALRAAVEAERDRPFDLEEGPLFRTALFRCGDETVALLIAHHLVADGLSIVTLLYEFLGVLEPSALAPFKDLPRTTAQFTDIVEAEAALLHGPETEGLLATWRETLAEPRVDLDLPGDRPRPDLPSYAGGSVPIAFDPETSLAIRALAKETGATTFVVLLATFSMFLARQAGVTDVSVGTSFATGRDERFYRVVGNMVNALPLRVQMRWTTSLRTAIGMVRTATLNAIGAQALPLSRIAKDLRPDRTMGAFPFFNTFFTFQQLESVRDVAALAAGFGGEMQLGALTVAPFPIALQPGQFDLTLSIGDFEDRYRGNLHFARDLFDDATAERLAADYITFATMLVRDPDTTLMPAAERVTYVETVNETTRALDPAPFVTQWQARAAAAPDAIALVHGTTRVMQGELETRANRLAQHLRAHGIGRGARVGLALERSPELLVALLAVQKTGAAYVPLDPGFPDDRLAFMVADSGIGLLLSDAGVPDWLPETDAPVTIDIRADAAAIAAREPTPPADGPRAEDVAYLIYTSGSTGRPNGVVIAHGALANFLGSMLTEPGLDADDVLAAVTTISFDIAGLELYLPLLAGARIILVDRDVASDGAALATLLGTSGVTTMQATPATWRLLIEADWTPPPAFRALCGGEPLPRDLAEALLARDVVLWNLYGPTETTIWSTAGEVRSAAQIDVGAPIANTRVYILDEALTPVPVGVRGSIWIGGSGVAIGYHDRPELTAARFVANPFVPGERMYRTGDAGRWSAAGRIVHLGREDNQVKLRGWRIEPGEIEAALATHEDVARAVVVLAGDAGDQRLVAYVVPTEGGEILANPLRRHLRRTLPDYMIPALFVEIDAVPLTPNGKVNRAALPDPFGGKRARKTGHVEPEPGLETVLADIWRRVLDIRQVGANDNFFELGGHSLLSLRVAAQLKQETGLELPMRSLFFQTLREIAATLNATAPKMEAIAG